MTQTRTSHNKGEDKRALSEIKYVEKHYTLRILGETARRNCNPRKLGSIMEIKLTIDEVLKVKMVGHPDRGEPATAIEV